jgi:hypothetical protein
MIRGRVRFFSCFLTFFPSFFPPILISFYPIPTRTDSLAAPLAPPPHLTLNHFTQHSLSSPSQSCGGTEEEEEKEEKTKRKTGKIFHHLLNIGSQKEFTPYILRIIC